MVFLGTTLTASAQNYPYTNRVYVLGGDWGYCLPSGQEEVFRDIGSACNRVREYMKSGLNGQPPTFQRAIDPTYAPSEEEANAGYTTAFTCYWSVTDYFGTLLGKTGCDGLVRPLQSGLSLTLTLTPTPNQKDPRPKGTETKDTKSTYELIAKVTENGSPKQGVAVTFAVEVAANSGGHDHHDASRPKGKVKVISPSSVTDANGEIKVQFQASEFSGTHVVAAFCSTCTNTSVTKNVDVKVPGLSPLGHDIGPPKFIYWGSKPIHFENHWFTAPAKISLAKLVETLFTFEWFPVGINDGSLQWGGSFDVPGTWVVGTNHAEHRIGEEVDLSFLMGTNAAKIKRSYYEICNDKKIDIPSTILWHDVPLNEGGKYGPHFHVRLNGTYTQGAISGKPARCSRDSGN